MKLPMTSTDMKNVACATLLALLGGCAGSTQPVIPPALCNGLGDTCAGGATCCIGFACDQGTKTCLLINVDGGACQADLLDCTANPNWCCAGSYCDPLITTCQAASTAAGACSVQGGDCTMATCCTDLACDADAGVCVNTYQALGGACTAPVQCAGTPAGAGTVPAACDSTASVCCIDTGNDCTANPTFCCTGAYCDPVPNTCASAAGCGAPTAPCMADTDCCTDLACDTDAGDCIVPSSCSASGTACTSTTTCCGYCDPILTMCASATDSDGGTCLTPLATCAVDSDCCADLVCDVTALICVGCSDFTQGCGVQASDGGVDGGTDAGTDAGTTDGGKADAGDGG